MAKKNKSGASAATMAAFNQLKASGNAGSGIAGGAQAYWNNNAAEAERIRKLQEQQAAAQRAQQAAAAAEAQRQIQESQRAAQERSRTQEYQQQLAAQQAATQKAEISKKNNLSQNLRAASGANGVLSEKELLKISKASGKSSERVLEKAVGKGLTIGSKVVNQYQKGAYTDPRLNMLRQALPGFAMAAGKDSTILQQLRNAGRQDKGSALFIGSKGSTATTLPRKLGLGEGYRPPGGDNNVEQVTPTDTGTGATEEIPMTPMIPEEPQSEMPGVGMMSGGGEGAAGANKLGRAKSRLRKLGIYGRGTGLLGRGLQYGNALNK